MSEGADYAADSDLDNANEQRDGRLTSRPNPCPAEPGYTLPLQTV